MGKRGIAKNINTHLGGVGRAEQKRIHRATVFDMRGGRISQDSIIYLLFKKKCTIK